MSASIPRAWFPCCGHCSGWHDDSGPGSGHTVPCLVCQIDAPSLFDAGGES